MIRMLDRCQSPADQLASLQTNHVQPRSGKIGPENQPVLPGPDNDRVEFVRHVGGLWIVDCGLWLMAYGL